MIEDGAFNGCRSITSVKIPVGVTEIGEGAFFRCSTLTSVTIPEGVTKIGGMAFESCTSLVVAVVPRSCNFINVYAFADCPNLTLVVAPDAFDVYRTAINDEYEAGGTIESVFEGSPLLTLPGYITPNTPEAIITARRLEYWTPMTHQLCHPTRREWVKFVILVFHRLEIPSVPGLKILKMLKRYELGP